MNSIVDAAGLTPARARVAIRRGEITGPTTGFCAGYAQGNLVVLPKDLAWDFLLFCQRNPKACPLLEVADAGQRSFARFAPGSDIATDLPRYRVYRTGNWWPNPPMWPNILTPGTTWSASSSGAASPSRAPCWRRTSRCARSRRGSTSHVPHQHPLRGGGGVPRQYGGQHAAHPPQAGAGGGGHHGGHAPGPRRSGADRLPEAIGITDLAHPDFGDPVTIRPGEVPVFWPCGVTPQAAIMASRPAFCITHAPGHMFLTDVKNTALRF